MFYHTVLLNYPSFRSYCIWQWKTQLLKGWQKRLKLLSELSNSSSEQDQVWLVSLYTHRCDQSQMHGFYGTEFFISPARQVNMPGLNLKAHYLSIFSLHYSYAYPKAPHSILPNTSPSVCCLHVCGTREDYFIPLSFFPIWHQLR